MEFIESTFGMSPDAGSGLFEALLFVVPLAIVLSLGASRQTFRRLVDWLNKC
jgi:hypothetical protein